MDLNADLAEGGALTPIDRALLDVVTSASLACGFHAGSRSVMRAAAESCVERGIAIGAHVSYRDRQGFGRRALRVPAERLAADLVEQWEALVDEVSAAGGRVTYVKPHGALYNVLATDAEVATTVVDALAPRCTVLVGPPGGALAGPAAAAGVQVVPEGFCDRGYDAGGLLVPRGEDGALVADPVTAGERARSLATEGGIHAVDGTWVALSVRTLCIHGDGPGADRHGRAVRDALAAAGVEVRAFAPGGEA
ncbi:MAG TPA: 5-oxoprolinase subunit PxpA [Acidimicrobiales bacterium]